MEIGDLPERLIVDLDLALLPFEAADPFDPHAPKAS
jgi:hypothetical protein